MSICKPCREAGEMLTTGRPHEAMLLHGYCVAICPPGSVIPRVMAVPTLCDCQHQLEGVNWQLVPELEQDVQAVVE